MIELTKEDRAAARAEAPRSASDMRVVVARRLPEPVEARLSELFDVRFAEGDAPMSRAALIEAARDADVIVPTLRETIDQNFLAQAGDRLRLIANYGAGVDHIDVATARSRGVLVTNTPGVLTEDTADMAMALILAAPRRLLAGMKVMATGDWEGWSPTGMLGARISGKRLGILGMGRIGQAVARRAAAFGLEIHYHDRSPLRDEEETALGARYWESFDQMLARVDILTVHCPHTPATYHLLSARRLQLMKPGAYIVNTARGEVIDERALTRLLEQGVLGGAALDVYENADETVSRLGALENVVLLPHMASATLESRLEMGEKVIINIKTFADGHRPPDQVLPSML